MIYKNAPFEICTCYIKIILSHLENHVNDFSFFFIYNFKQILNHDDLRFDRGRKTSNNEIVIYEKLYIIQVK